MVYLVSFGITVAGSVMVAMSRSMVLFIGMRALQAVGRVMHPMSTFHILSNLFINFNSSSAVMAVLAH